MGEQGIVTSVGSRSVTVHIEARGEVRCRLRGNLWVAERDDTTPVAVGDRVTVTIEADEGTIDEVLPRDNRLGRPPPLSRSGSASRRRPGKPAPVQVIAANLDQLIVVASLADPPFRPGLVDRFLVAADMQGIDAVVCLNKVDLEDQEGVPGREVAAPYRLAGFKLLETSTHTGEGIPALADLMASGISLLVGHSGVGKSSLINAVSPGLQLATRHVADYHGRGRHTTTRVSLLRLESGGWVVDSPGIREFALERIPLGELARLFPGFGELPSACRFSNCRHRSEPGCAVLAAVDADAFDGERYLAYLKLLEEVESEQ